MIKYEGGRYIIENSEEEKAAILKNLDKMGLSEEDKKEFIKSFLNKRTETSGLWLDRFDDGSIRVGCEDYNVEYFGGDDFEYWYDMNKENAEKFFAALKEEYPQKETAEEQAVEAFTIELLDSRFREFCDRHGIEFTYGSWV